MKKNYTKRELELAELGSQKMFHFPLKDTLGDFMKMPGMEEETIIDAFIMVGEAFEGQDKEEGEGK
jgi:hypothetical protein